MKVSSDFGAFASFPALSFSLRAKGIRSPALAVLLGWWEHPEREGCEGVTDGRFVQHSHQLWPLAWTISLSWLTTPHDSDSAQLLSFLSTFGG